MAVTTFPLIARSRTAFPRLGPSTGPIIRQFPSNDSLRSLTAPRRPGVGSPTNPERQGAHYASADPTGEPSMDALLVRAIDAGLEGLNSLERQARDMARRLRGGVYADAAQARNGLRELVAATERLVTLAAASVDASGTDLTTFCETRGLRPEAETAALMHEIVRHQRADDGPALASTLERRFVAALEEWRQLFFALGDAPTDPSGHAA